MVLQQQGRVQPTYVQRENGDLSREQLHSSLFYTFNKRGVLLLLNGESML